MYNFARDVLENVPKVAEFDFAKLPQYITSSQDETLAGLLETEGRTFAGSTSSTIGMLCQVRWSILRLLGQSHSPAS